MESSDLTLEEALLVGGRLAELYNSVKGQDSGADLEGEDLRPEHVFSGALAGDALEILQQHATEDEAAYRILRDIQKGAKRIADKYGSPTSSLYFDHAVQPSGAD